MFDAEIEKVKDYIEECEKHSKLKVYSSIELEYDDTDQTGLFGITDEDYPEPFFGLFWCKGDGKKRSNGRDFDMNISMSVTHARQIYEFLKEVFG